MFAVSNKTGKPLPVSENTLRGIYRAVLGGTYNLSVAFIGGQTARTLSRRYRGKDTATDILSFPLDKNEGEMFIHPASAAREAPHFNFPPEKFILFLFIHGLLHLKGYTHGSRMETQERKFRKKFNI